MRLFASAVAIPLLASCGACSGECPEPVLGEFQNPRLHWRSASDDWLVPDRGRWILGLQGLVVERQVGNYARYAVPGAASVAVSAPMLPYAAGQYLFWGDAKDNHKWYRWDGGSVVELTNGPQDKPQIPTSKLFLSEVCPKPWPSPDDTCLKPIGWSVVDLDTMVYQRFDTPELKGAQPQSDGTTVVVETGSTLDTDDPRRATSVGLWQDGATNLVSVTTGNLGDHHPQVNGDFVAFTRDGTLRLVNWRTGEIKSFDPIDSVYPHYWLTSDMLAWAAFDGSSYTVKSYRLADGQVFTYERRAAPLGFNFAAQGRTLGWAFALRDRSTCRFHDAVGIGDSDGNKKQFDDDYLDGLAVFGERMAYSTAVPVAPRP